MFQEVKNHRQRSAMQKLFFLSVLNILISCIIAAVSALFPVVVPTRDRLAHVEFGYPFPFVTQNFLASGDVGYEGDFPHRFKISLDNLDKDPQITFSLIDFLLSASLIFAAFSLAYLLIIAIMKKKY